MACARCPRYGEAGADCKIDHDCEHFAEGGTDPSGKLFQASCLHRGEQCEYWQSDGGEREAGEGKWKVASRLEGEEDGEYEVACAEEHGEDSECECRPFCCRQHGLVTVASKSWFEQANASLWPNMRNHVKIFYFHSLIRLTKTAHRAYKGGTKDKDVPRAYLGASLSFSFFQ